MNVIVTPAGQALLDQYPEFRDRLQTSLRAATFAPSCQVDAAAGPPKELILRCDDRPAIRVAEAELANAGQVDPVMERLRRGMVPRTFLTNVFAPEFWTTAWRIFILVLILLAAASMGWGIFRLHITTEDVADGRFIRGLVTTVLLVAMLVLVTIIILTALFADNEVSTIKRVGQTREILTPLFGILGTIVGFYFASTTVTAPSGPAARVQALGGTLHGNVLLLNGSKVQDADLADLVRALPDLEGIDLDDTGVSDEGLKALQRLKKLHWVSLRNVKISEDELYALKKSRKDMQVIR